MLRRGAERRRFVRVDDEMIVSIAPHEAEAERDGHTLNFSAGGVLLVSAQRIDPGHQITVTLRTGKDERPLVFDASVTRVRTLSDHAHEIAAEFVGGSAADQRALQALIVQRLTPRSPSPSPQTA